MITAFSNLVNLISPSSGGVYESARLNDNLDGTGGITLSWNADTYAVLPVGTSITYNDTKYSLLEPYAPTKASALHYRYEPTFLHPLARLARVPFYIKSADVKQNVTYLYTSYFTGYPRTIAQKLADFFSEYGEIDTEFGSTFGTWTHTFEGAQNVNTVITVNFDGCSIKAAASRIADAIGCNVFFDWATHTIRFVVGSSIEGDTYNCFRVLGGTTNMAKRTFSGMLAPVTQRLTLDPAVYPDSMMVVGTPEIRLTTDLILDDIYPKMELEIADTHERTCYLTDDDGKKIIDHYELNGITVSSDTTGAVAVYKTYSKWYVLLRHTDGTPYSHDVNNQIADKPLSLLFQPDYTNTLNTCPLAGRQFELVYFPATTTEWEEDDTVDVEDAWQIPGGWFRIIFAAEGDTILPSTGGEGLIPQGETSYNGVAYRGNIVTLVNVGLDDTYTTMAQTRLATEASKIVALYAQRQASYTKTIVSDIPKIGAEHTDSTLGNGIVTNISADLDTGVADITVGSWSSKTLTGGIRDKIDSISVTNSSPTINEGDKGLSKSQFEALWKTTKKPSIDSEQINTLSTDVEAIKAQSDAKFYIVYGYGVPTNATEPARTWIEEGTEEEYVGDIYYNTARGGASQGGRAYRWVKAGTVNGSVVYTNGVPVEYDSTEHTGFVYMWAQITDMDTNASLERIADVASDSLITGGAEKTRVYLEWRNAAEQYNDTLTSATSVGVSTTALTDAYWRLWWMLNDQNKSQYSGKPSGYDYDDMPAWFGSLSSDSAITNGYSASDYRTLWDNFYSELSATIKAITGQELTIIGSKTAYFVSTSVPSAPYQVGDMWLKLSSSDSSDGELYTCITACMTTGSESESHWKRVQSYGVSVTNLLSELAVRLYTNHSIEDMDTTLVSVYIQSTQPSSMSTNVWLDTSTSPAELHIGSYTVSDDEIVSIIAELYSVIGQNPIRIYKSTPSSAAALQKYDVLAKYDSFTDHFTHRTIKGSLGVWVYDGNAWVKVLDDTTGILQNFGDAIIMAVFGVNSVNPNVTYASGITTSSNFSAMFASAIDEETGTTELAAIKTIIEYENGSPTGLVSIDASRINFQGKTITLTAQGGLAITGGTINIGTSGMTTNLNLSAATLSLNADQITWKDKTIITNGTGNNKVIKFAVDSEGNLQASGLLADEAVIQGSIVASTLLAPKAQINEITSQNIESETFISVGNDGCYTRITNGRFEIGLYDSTTGTYTQVYRTRLENGTPILECVLNEGGTSVINTIDGKQINSTYTKTVADSWTEKDYIALYSRTRNYANCTDVDYEDTIYQLTEGYTQTGVNKQYNHGGVGEGKWFTEEALTNYSTNYYVSGYFAEKEVGTDYYFDNNNVQYRRNKVLVHHFEAGVITSSEYVYDTPVPTGFIMIDAEEGDGGMIKPGSGPWSGGGDIIQP